MLYRVSSMRNAYGTEVICDHEKTRMEINDEPYPLPLDHVT